MNTDTTNNVAGSITRHTLTAGGIAGLLNSQDDLLRLASTIIAAIGLAWSIMEKLRRPPAPPQPPAPPAALLLVLVLVLVLGTGCNTLTFTAVKPDGTQVTVKSSRFLWSTEQYSATVKDFGALTASKSSVDSVAIAAAAQGAVAGAIAASTGRPISGP